MIIPVWTSFQETTMLVHGSNPCNSMATCLDPAPKTVSTKNCRLKKWPLWYLEAPLELELVKYVKFSVVFNCGFILGKSLSEKTTETSSGTAPRSFRRFVWSLGTTCDHHWSNHRGDRSREKLSKKAELDFLKISRNNIYIIIKYVYIIVWMFRFMFFPNETRGWNRSDNSVMLHGPPSAIESVGWNWAHNPRTLRRPTMVRNLDFCHSEILLVLSN